MRIRCEFCRYAEIDKSACLKRWTAYQCGNPLSEFYHALLNVDLDGMPIPSEQGITWDGCEQGKE